MAAPACAALRARSAAMRVLKWLVGDDHRHAAGDVREAQVEQRVALGVGQQELLGVVGEDADAVDALVDHAVEHAALPVEVEVAGVGERRRRDGEHAPVGPCRGWGHRCVPPGWSCRVARPARTAPRGWPAAIQWRTGVARRQGRRWPVACAGTRRREGVSGALLEASFETQLFELLLRMRGEGAPRPSFRGAAGEPELHQPLTAGRCDGRRGFSCIVSGHGFRAPLRGPGMTVAAREAGVSKHEGVSRGHGRPSARDCGCPRGEGKDAIVEAPPCGSGSPDLGCQERLDDGYRAASFALARERRRDCANEDSSAGAAGGTMRAAVADRARTAGDRGGRAPRAGPGPGAHPARGLRRLRLEPDAVGRAGLDAVPDRARRARARGLGRRRRGRARASRGSRAGDRVAALSYKAYAEYDLADAGRGGAAAGRARRTALPGRAARLRHEHLPPERDRGRADGRDRRHRLPRRDPDAARGGCRRAGDRHLAAALLARRRAAPSGAAETIPMEDHDGDHRAGEGADRRRVLRPGDRGGRQAMAARPRRRSSPASAAGWSSPATTRTVRGRSTCGCGTGAAST